MLLQKVVVVQILFFILKDNVEKYDKWLTLVGDSCL